MIAQTRERAAARSLRVSDWAGAVLTLEDLRPQARDACIYYLKSSGESITELLKLNDDDLFKWFRLVRQQNDKRREQAEEMRRAQESAQRRKRLPR